MSDESRFCDEVIITASDDAYSDITGESALVLRGFRESDAIWYAAYVPGGKVWNVKACDTVPTGRRFSAPAAL